MPLQTPLVGCSASRWSSGGGCKTVSGPGLPQRFSLYTYPEHMPWEGARGDVLPEEPAMQTSHAVAVTVLAILAAAPPAAGFEAAGEPPGREALAGVVPAPARMSRGEGAFALNARTRIIVNGPPEFRSVAELLAQRLRPSTGFPLRVVAGAGDRVERDNAIVLEVVNAAVPAGAPSTIQVESYSLEVTPRTVTLSAGWREGLFYAAQTLRQLLPPGIESPTRVRGVEWRIPAVRIEDAPRFAWRGYMLDSSRHLQSVDFIKRTLDRMAYHKLNVFHWHITDDPGWRLESKLFPKLTSVGAWRTNADGRRYGGFYTQAQILDILRYAAERNITVVPEIEMPGHSAGAVASYPFLACDPDRPGGHRVLKVAEGIISVCPGKETTYAFFQDLLTEVMGLFPSKIIHIGGDEVDKAPWRACPDCQATIKREGLKDEKELQHYFIRRTAEFLESKRRRLQGWNEIMEGGPLPKGVVMQQWNDPESGARAARAGNDVVVSPVTWGYFDYSYDTTPLREVYEAEPVPAGLTPEQEARILGPQANLWTEWLPDDAAVDDFTWPRLIALAEVGWSPKAARDWEGFTRRLRGGHFERLARMGLGVAGETRESILARLADRSELDPGIAIGAWAPEQMSEEFKTMDWDLTPHVKAPGVYEVRMAYEAGAHGIALAGAWLLRDGEETAKDVHEGFAGGAHRNNRFRLRLDEVKPGARYTVRVRLRSDAGTDSRGRVWVRALPVAGKLSERSLP